MPEIAFIMGKSDVMRLHWQGSETAATCDLKNCSSIKGSPIYTLKEISCVSYWNNEI